MSNSYVVQGSFIITLSGIKLVETLPYCLASSPFNKELLPNLRILATALLIVKSSYLPLLTVSNEFSSADLTTNIPYSPSPSGFLKSLKKFVYYSVRTTIVPKSSSSSSSKVTPKSFGRRSRRGGRDLSSSIELSF